MENRVSYILIGIFVFVLFGATVGSILWLGKYSQSQVYSYYKVVTQESVSGLSQKAPVKLRGVNVGEVKDIFIDSKNSEDVVVLIRVKEGTPIKEDTYAILKPQGITGLNFIELEGGSNDSKILPTGKDLSSYGTIPSKSSMFTRLDNTLEMLGDKTDRMMSEKNLRNLETILENLVLTTERFNKSIENFSNDTQELKSVFSQALKVEKAMIEASKKVALMSEHISVAVNDTGIDTMESMRQAAHTVSRVMNGLETRVQKGTFDIDILLKENLLPLQSAMGEFRLLMIEARKSLEKFSDSPSDIMYKQMQIEPAPNEELK